MPFSFDKSHNIIKKKTFFPLSYGTPKNVTCQHLRGVMNEEDNLIARNQINITV